MSERASVECYLPRCTTNLKNIIRILTLVFYERLRTQPRLADYLLMENLNSYLIVKWMKQILYKMYLFLRK